MAKRHILFKRRRDDEARVGDIVDKSVEALAESVASILSDSDADHHEKAEALGKTFDQFDAHLKRFAKGPAMVPDDDDDTSTEGGDALHPKLEAFVSAMLTANPALRREEALNYLLHTRDGRATARHLAEITKVSNQKDEIKMNRSEKLADIAKTFGVAKLAKFINDEGRAHGISEHEFTKLIDVEAQKTRKTGERPEAAFARYFEAPENADLRRAHNLTKSFPRLMEVEPRMIGGGDVDVNDSGKAYDQLVALAEEQRRRAPTLTAAQAFARAFEDNPALAAKAHRRPSAADAYR